MVVAGMLLTEVLAWERVVDAPQDFGVDADNGPRAWVRRRSSDRVVDDKDLPRIVAGARGPS